MPAADAGNDEQPFRRAFKMGFDANVEFLRIAFWQIILAAGPLLAVALIVGLIIGIIQAATSINEMTLSFVPKLVIVVMTFGLLSTFMLTQLSDYFAFIFDQITRIG
jgi:flagellar biosynthetic protein FliQ